METKSKKIPTWYWVAAIFFLLWNLMGVMSFLQHSFITEEALNEMSHAESDLYRSYPTWTYIVFAIAVFGGLLGSIGLLLRKSWAKIAFVISLVAIIPQMTQNLFFSNAREVYGPGTEIMPILVIVIGVFLVWFSSYAIRKNWLN